jgi:DNA helicase IV
MAQQLRERIDKWDYMKQKSFCTKKEMVTRLKRQPTEWKKIFVSYTSDKGLTTRIYREFKKLNSKKKKINDPMKKWVNELNRVFSKEEIKNGPKNDEEMLSIPGHKGNANQNHAKIPRHSCGILTPVRMAIVQNTNNNKCW